MSDPSTSGDATLRIGEFSRRVGVSEDLLRAWERRYGLLRPSRSAGGFRLYSADDADRVARMRLGLQSGLSAAQAAQAAMTSAPPPASVFDDSIARLRRGIEGYDEVEVNGILDESFEAFGLEPTLVSLILPVLAGLGEGWEEDPGEIGREHFASNLIRTRLLSLIRLGGRGSGPLALLACPEGERHDITLICFGLLLRSSGWRIVLLGADTPLATVERAVESMEPDATVIASFDESLLERAAPALERLAKLGPLFLSGPGASADLCARLGVDALGGELTAAAAGLERQVPLPGESVRANG